MRKLWILPLAALLCGRPVNPPRLKPLIPVFKKKSCEEIARKNFLWAYAYRLESAAKSRRHLDQAEKILGNCEDGELRKRIEALKNSSL